jgi:hypothetical protein
MNIVTWARLLSVVCAAAILIGVEVFLHTVLGVRLWGMLVIGIPVAFAGMVTGLLVGEGFLRHEKRRLGKDE